jgi:hypothetical protein
MKLAIIRELIQFIFDNKKWWVGTLLLLLVLLGFILVLGEGSPLAPLIYTLF